MTVDIRPAPDSTESPVGLEYVRVFEFLRSIGSVYVGNSCLTEPGAAYLGIPFRFPTMAEQAVVDEPDTATALLRLHDSMRRPH